MYGVFSAIKVKAEKGNKLTTINHSTIPTKLPTNKQRKEETEHNDANISTTLPYRLAKMSGNVNA